MTHDHVVEDGQYVCTVCERAFDSKEELLDHVHDEGQLE